MKEKNKLKSYYSRLDIIDLDENYIFKTGQKYFSKDNIIITVSLFAS